MVVDGIASTYFCFPTFKWWEWGTFSEGCLPGLWVVLVAPLPPLDKRLPPPPPTRRSQMSSEVQKGHAWALWPLESLRMVPPGKNGRPDGMMPVHHTIMTLNYMLYPWLNPIWWLCIECRATSIFYMVSLVERTVERDGKVNPTFVLLSAWSPLGLLKATPALLLA